MDHSTPVCHHCFAVAGNECFGHSEAISVEYCWVCRKLLCCDHHDFHATHWTSMMHRTTNMNSLPKDVLKAYRLVDPQLFSPSPVQLSINNTGDCFQSHEAISLVRQLEHNPDKHGEGYVDLMPPNTARHMVGVDVQPGTSVDTSSASCAEDPAATRRISASTDPEPRSINLPSNVVEDVVSNDFRHEVPTTSQGPVSGDHSSDMSSQNLSPIRNLDRPVSPSQDCHEPEGVTLMPDSDSPTPSHSPVLRGDPDLPSSLEQTSPGPGSHFPNRFPCDDCDGVPGITCNVDVDLGTNNPPAVAQSDVPASKVEPSEEVVKKKKRSRKGKKKSVSTEHPNVATQDSVQLASRETFPDKGPSSSADIKVGTVRTSVHDGCSPTLNVKAIGQEVPRADVSARTTLLAKTGRASGTSHEWNEVPMRAGEGRVFSKLGISLQVLEEFLFGRCNGRGVLQGLTTREVCERFIKPDTQSRQTSYCELLEKEGLPGIREATVFVSHAWDDLFLEVVDALLQCFKGPCEESSARDGGDVVLWFDLFSRNQHDATPVTTEWLVEVLKPGIAAIGTTVLVLTPSGDYLPLRRTWCLFEILCQGSENVRIATSGNVDLPFSFHAEDFFTFPWYPRFPIEGSGCSDDKEKSCLLAAARQINSGLIFAADKHIAAALSRASLIRLDPHESYGFASLQSAMVHFLEGHVNEAIRLAKEVVEIRESGLGACHRDTLRARYFLAFCLDVTDASGSLTMFADVLQKQKDSLGADHEDTYLTRVFMCVKKMRQKEYLDEATVCLRHIPTSSALMYLSETYGALGKLLDAIGVAKDAVARYTSDRGPHDYATYSAKLVLGKHLLESSSLNEAETLLQECRDGLESLAGSDHPQTMLASLRLGIVYYRRNQFSKAIAALEDTIVNRCHLVISLEGKSMVTSYEDILLDCYLKTGNPDAALELGITLLAKRKESNADTSIATCTIGHIYLKKGEFHRALPFLRQVYEKLRLDSGIIHHSTGIASVNLAKCLLGDGKTAEALQLVQDVLNAIRKNEEPAPPSLLMDLLKLLGDGHKMNGNPTAALSAYEQAWDVQANRPLLPGASVLLASLVGTYSQFENCDKIFSVLTQAFDAYGDSFDEDDPTVIALRHIFSLKSAKNSNTSSLVLDLSQSIHENSSDPWKIAKALIGRATGDVGERIRLKTENLNLSRGPPSKRMEQLLSEMRNEFFQKKDVLGEDHPDYPPLLRHHIGQLCAFGLHAEAEPLARDLLGRHKVQLGNKDKRTLEATHTLGEICSRIGKGEEAAELLEDALERLRETFGPCDPQAITTLLALADHYVILNQLEDSKRLLVKFVKRDGKLLGLDNKSVLEAKFRIARLHLGMGKGLNAVELANEVVETRTKIMGEEDASTIDAKYLLAECYASNQQFEEALTLHRETMALETRALGDDHPRVLNSVHKKKEQIALWESNQSLLSMTEHLSHSRPKAVARRRHKK